MSDAISLFKSLLDTSRAAWKNLNDLSLGADLVPEDLFSGGKFDDFLKCIAELVKVSKNLVLAKEDRELVLDLGKEMESSTFKLEKKANGKKFVPHLRRLLAATMSVYELLQQQSKYYNDNLATCAFNVGAFNARNPIDPVDKVKSSRESIRYYKIAYSSYKAAALDYPTFREDAAEAAERVALNASAIAVDDEDIKAIIEFCKEALAIYEELCKEKGTHAKNAAEIAKKIGNWYVKYPSSKPDILSAAQYIKKALVYYRMLPPDKVENLEEIAIQADYAGQLFSTQAQWIAEYREEARALFEESMAVYDKINDRKFDGNLAASIIDLANNLYSYHRDIASAKTDRTRAAQLYTRAAEIYRMLREKKPDFNFQLGMTLMRHGNLLKEFPGELVSDMHSARRLMQEGISILETVARSNPSKLHELQGARMDFALLLSSNPEDPEADRHVVKTIYQDVLEYRRKSSAEGNLDELFNLGAVLTNFAIALKENPEDYLGDIKLSGAMYDESLVVFKKLAQKYDFFKAFVPIATTNLAVYWTRFPLDSKDPVKGYVKARLLFEENAKDLRLLVQKNPAMNDKLAFTLAYYATMLRDLAGATGMVDDDLNTSRNLYDFSFDAFDAAGVSAQNLAQRCIAETNLGMLLRDYPRAADPIADILKAKTLLEKAIEYFKQVSQASIEYRVQRAIGCRELANLIIKHNGIIDARLSDAMPLLDTAMEILGDPSITSIPRCIQLVRCKKVYIDLLAKQLADSNADVTLGSRVSQLIKEIIGEQSVIFAPYPEEIIFRNQVMIDAFLLKAKVPGLDIAILTREGLLAALTEIGRYANIRSDARALWNRYKNDGAISAVLASSVQFEMLRGEIVQIEMPKDTIHNLITAGSQLTFLVGAGCSIEPPSCLPAGRAMMDAMIDFACIDSEAKRIKAMKDIRFEGLVEILNNNIDPDMKVIDYYGLCDKPNLQHFFLAEMIKKGHFVMTTNFDFLIEHAMLQSGIKKEDIAVVITRADFEKFSNPIELAKAGKATLYKVHGSMGNLITGSNSRDSLVATIQAFGSNKEGLNVFQIEPFKKNLFDNISRGRTIVVMGYSGSDDFDIVPTLKVLPGVKEFIWLNHVGKDQGITEIREITESMPVTTAETDKVDQILHDIKGMNNNAKVFRVNANTGRLLKTLASISPPISKEPFTASPVEYLKSTIKPPSDITKVWIPFRIYLTFDKYHDALECAELLQKVAERENSTSWKAKALHERAVILQRLGDVKTAVQLLEDCIAISEKSGNESEIASISLTMANIAMDKGESTKAIELNQKALEIFRKLGRPKSIAVTLNNIALIHKSSGALADALKVYKEVLKIADETGSLVIKGAVLNNIAMILVDLNDLDEALKHFELASKIGELLGDTLAIADRCVNISEIYDRQGKYEEGLKECQAALVIFKKIGNKSRQAACLNNIGKFLHKLKKDDEAAKIYKESLEINESVNDIPQIAATTFNMAILARDAGRIDDALVNYEKSLDAFKRIGNLPRVARVLNSMALMFESQDNLARAMQCNDEAIKIHEKLGRKDKIALCLNNIAFILKKQGNLGAAIQKLDEAIKLIKEAGQGSSKEAKMIEKNLAAFKEEMGSI